MTGPCLPAGWPAPPGVHAFTTLRHGAGISPPPFEHFNLGGREDDPAHIAHNRTELIERFNLPSPPCWLNQVHGIGVHRFDTPATPDIPAPEADAAVTSLPGVVLAVLTADCLPVVLAARDGTEIAVAHAGWRGLAAGILECTVKAMRPPVHEVVAWLGPAAGPEMYEIGQDVFDAFTGENPHAMAAFAWTRPGHWRVDLYTLARLWLQMAGLKADHIYGGGLCTLSDSQRFYSHRRDVRTGRMATLVWRKTENPCRSVDTGKNRL